MKKDKKYLEDPKEFSHKQVWKKSSGQSRHAKQRMFQEIINSEMDEQPYQQAPQPNIRII